MKTTKKERKRINPRNAAVRRSLKHGEIQHVGNTVHMGCNPHYVLASRYMTQYKTPRIGVPFVRIDLCQQQRSKT